MNKHTQQTQRKENLHDKSRLNVCFVIKRAPVEGQTMENMTGTHKDGFKRLNEENQRLRERKYVFTKMKLLRKWPAVIKDL